MKVKILRQRHPGAKPYWQTFNYDGDINASVAAVLDSINYRDDIVDSEGNATDRISWECSCLQGMCGGCAMVINNVPALACARILYYNWVGRKIKRPERRLVYDKAFRRRTVADFLPSFAVWNRVHRKGSPRFRRLPQIRPQAILFRQTESAL